MTSQYISQAEFETRFHALLRYRDETAIAEEIGKSESWVSKMFNPNHPAASPLFRAAAILTAWIVRSPQRGRAALRLFVEFVERAVPSDKTQEKDLAERMEQAQHALCDLWEAAQDMPDIRWQAKELVYQYRKEKYGR